LAAEAEARLWAMTREHACTLMKMRPQKRILDKHQLQLTDDEDYPEEPLEEEEQDSLVQELLRTHTKRKNMLEKALAGNEDEEEEDHNFSGREENVSKFTASLMVDDKLSFSALPSTSTTGPGDLR